MSSLELLIEGTKQRAEALAIGAQVAVRRARRGPHRAEWSWSLETLVETMRVGGERTMRMSFDRWRREQAINARSVLPARGVEELGDSIAGLDARWYVARGCEHAPVVFYLHGGGYVTGSLDTHRGICSRLARSSRLRVLAISYRLAPEHPFPAAIEDATRAYRYLLECGHRPARLAMAGDSAGAGLTVATLTVLRDAGDPLPTCALLMCPWVDLEGSSPSIAKNVDTDWGDRRTLDIYADAYTQGHDKRDPLCSPIYADLRGLPPLKIQVGTGELLYDEAVRLAERARAAGVDTDLREWKDMVHDWHVFAPFVKHSELAMDEAGAMLRRHL